MDFLFSSVQLHYAINHPKFYLALEKYFDYLKIAQVNELQKIAQELGAKHFR